MIFPGFGHFWIDDLIDWFIHWTCNNCQDDQEEKQFVVQEAEEQSNKKKFESDYNLTLQNFMFFQV